MTRVMNQGNIGPAVDPRQIFQALAKAGQDQSNAGKNLLSAFIGGVRMATTPGLAKTMTAADLTTDPVMAAVPLGKELKAAGQKSWQPALDPDSTSGTKVHCMDTDIVPATVEPERKP